LEIKTTIERQTESVKSKTQTKIQKKILVVSFSQKV